MKTAHVLFNPAARGGRNRALREPIERALAQAGIDARVVETQARGDAERLAAEWGRLGHTVVAAGGDGTIHEAVNGLAGTPGTLGVLPLGTGNDFASAIGMPKGLADAAQALALAPTRALDLGHARWTDTAGRTFQRRFANCLGVGFDAHAAAIAAETKWIGGRAAYVMAVFRTLWAWRRPDLVVQVRAHGVDFHGPLFLCEIGNGHSVGGGFLITPDARLDDGLFDVCVVDHLQTARALTLMPTTFRGGHVGAPEVTMSRTDHLGLAVDGGRGIGVQADGESLCLDAVEMTVSVEAGAIPVVAPHLARGPKPVAARHYDSYPLVPGSTPSHARGT